MGLLRQILLCFLRLSLLALYFSSLSSLLFSFQQLFPQARILHMASSVKTLRVKIAHGDLRHDANTLTGFVELSVNADGSDTIEDIKKKIAVRSVLFVLLRAFFSLLKWMCVTHIIHTQMNTKKKLGNDVGRHHVRPAFTGVWAQRNQVREDVLRRPRARRNRADARRLLRTSLD